MPGTETLTWSRHYTHTGCLLGALGCMPVGILSGLVFSKIFSWHEDSMIGLVYLGSFVVLGAVTGTIARWYEVHTAVFTARQVRLKSRVRTRTLELADLTAVEVEHSGDTDEGYTQTKLRLKAPGMDDVEIDGRLDPEFARRLTLRFAPRLRVKETWKELEPPPASA